MEALNTILIFLNVAALSYLGYFIYSKYKVKDTFLEDLENFDKKVIEFNRTVDDYVEIVNKWNLEWEDFRKKISIRITDLEKNLKKEIDENEIKMGGFEARLRGDMAKGLQKQEGLISDLYNNQENIMQSFLTEAHDLKSKLNNQTNTLVQQSETINKSIVKFSENNKQLIQNEFKKILEDINNPNTI